MAFAKSDEASYLRGKAYQAGLRASTRIDTACDLLVMVELDGVPPREHVQRFRSAIDQAIARAGSRTGEPIRETWGLLPEHQAAMARLTARAPTGAPIPRVTESRGRATRPPRRRV